MDKLEIIAFEIGTKVEAVCSNLRGVVTKLELSDVQNDNLIKLFQVELTFASKVAYSPKSRSMVNFNVLSFSTSKIKFIGYPPFAIIQALDTKSFS